VKNRSYLGDGVYASFDGTNIILELETRGRILLNKENWHSLMEFFQKYAQAIDQQTQLIEIPSPIYDEVVAELRTLEVAEIPRTKLQ
jgi:hypothetical protein